jgi:hypothetical protein
MTAAGDAFPGYVKWLFALILALWVPVGVINFCVDPYFALGWSRAFGLKDDGSGFGRNTRFSKAFAVTRIQPDAVALGTSRVDHGIDIAHPGFSRDVQAAYNLGLDGAHIDELLAYLEHAESARPLHRAVVGLDLGSFGKFRRQEAFDPGLLATPESGHALQRWTALLTTYFSGEPLIDSINKLRQQSATPMYDLRTGRRTDRIFVERITACGGIRQAFLAREASDIQGAVGSKAGNEYSPASSADFQASLNSFRKLVRFARDKRIDLYLFISPTHARSMEELRLLGRWGTFEEWKRSLVAILAEENARSPSLPPTPLWDFSGYNSVTTEPVPTADSGVMQMRGYWELSHYRKQIGDMVLDRIFDHSKPPHPIPEDFGRLLTPENIDRQLRETEDAGALYRAREGGQLGDLERLVQSKGRISLRPGCG